MDVTVTAKTLILAVEDDECSLDILENYLSEAGYEVIPAEDCLVALQKLKENPEIKVILLDRVLPTTDGIELIRDLKRDERFKSIPIVVQTALALPEQVLESARAGALFHLSKPYDRLQLLRVVNAALNNGKSKLEK